MDLIDRQAAIDAMKDTFKGTMVGTRVAVDAINRLPSAEPRCIATIQLSQEQLDEAFEKVKSDILSVKPKTGKWTIEDVHSATYKYCCSECKAHHRARYDFCPTCGSKMEGEKYDNDAY